MLNKDKIGLTKKTRVCKKEKRHRIIEIRLHVNTDDRGSN